MILISDKQPFTMTKTCSKSRITNVITILIVSIHSIGRYSLAFDIEAARQYTHISYYGEFKLRLSSKHNSHQIKWPIKKNRILCESDADFKSKRISKSYAMQSAFKPNTTQHNTNTHRTIDLEWALFSVAAEVINECYLYWLCFFLAYTKRVVNMHSFLSE